MFHSFRKHRPVDVCADGAYARGIRGNASLAPFHVKETWGRIVLIEQRTYNIKPGTPVKEFLDSYTSLGLATQKRILEGFLGYFTNEFGTQNQVVHMWAFRDLEERRARRQKLAEDPEWQACIAVVRPMLDSQENKILYPTDFSPIRSLPIGSDDPLTAFHFLPEHL